MCERGRPKADNPRTKKVSVRLNEEEYKILSDYSKDNNQTMTESLKKTFFDKLEKEGKL